MAKDMDINVPMENIRDVLGTFFFHWRELWRWIVMRHTLGTWERDEYIYWLVDAVRCNAMA